MRTVLIAAGAVLVACYALTIAVLARRRRWLPLALVAAGAVATVLIVLGPMAVGSRSEPFDASPPTRRSSYAQPSSGVGDPGRLFQTPTCSVEGIRLFTADQAYPNATFTVSLGRGPAEPVGQEPLICRARVTLSRTDGRAVIVPAAQTVDLAGALDPRWAVTVGKPGLVDLVAVIEPIGCAPGMCDGPLPVLATIRVNPDPRSVRAAEALDTFTGDLVPKVEQRRAVRPHVPTALHLRLDLPSGVDVAARGIHEVQITLRSPAHEIGLPRAAEVVDPTAGVAGLDVVVTAGGADDFDIPVDILVTGYLRGERLSAVQSGIIRVDVSQRSIIERTVAPNVGWWVAAVGFLTTLAGLAGSLWRWVAARRPRPPQPETADERVSGYL